MRRWPPGALARQVLGRKGKPAMLYDSLHSGQLRLKRAGQGGGWQLAGKEPLGWVHGAPRGGRWEAG